jgi:hypothetical protein
MEYRREEWKEDRTRKRGVKGRWSTEDRNGRNVEYRREEWKDNGRQRRGVEGT